MEKNNNHNHNGSSNGFLLGVIVGVLITLLFTTQRGRAILKEVMEKGIDKFANLEDLMHETEDEYEEEEGEDYVPTEAVETPDPPKPQKVVEKKADEVTAQSQPKEEESPTPVKPEPEKPAEAIETAQEKIEETKETPVEEKSIEEKPKATRVKRLFRGLRKKS